MKHKWFYYVMKSSLSGNYVKDDVFLDPSSEVWTEEREFADRCYHLDEIKAKRKLVEAYCGNGRNPIKIVKVWYTPKGW